MDSKKRKVAKAKPKTVASKRQRKVPTLDELRPDECVTVAALEAAGEIADLGESLQPGQTHHRERHADGKIQVKRDRFKAF